MTTPVTWPAMLDGHAVRYDQAEAWVLNDGTWVKADYMEVRGNASIMSEDKFKELFGVVPDLPDEAFADGLRR